MLIRVVSLLVWAALAACAVYWGFKLFVTPLQTPAHAQLAITAAPLTADMSKLLGVEVVPVVAAATQTPPDARFQLVGVVAPKGAANAAANRQGVALIAVDGKAAKAYRVGALIDGEWVLQSVQARSASVGPKGAPAVATLQLPAVPVASTGTLPSATPGATPNMAPNMAPVSLPRPSITPPALQPTMPQGIAPSDAAGADPTRRAAPFNPAPSPELR